MGTPLHIDTLIRVIASSTGQGGKRLTQSKWDWDVAGGCDRPVLIELHARPPGNKVTGAKRIIVARYTAHPLQLQLWVPCRHCARCIKRKQSMWAARAMAEVSLSRRTWFCTFTVRPEEQYKLLLRGLAKKRERSIHDPLTEQQEFEVRASEVGAELTLALKRLRKELGYAGSLRYLLVTEAHKSGLPHFHALIHESGPIPIKHAQLAEQWKLGFCSFKLLDGDAKAAWYVCKYLGKGAQARVRASLHYGRRPSPSSTIMSEANVNSVASTSTGETPHKKGGGRNETLIS